MNQRSIPDNVGVLWLVFACFEPPGLSAEEALQG